MIYICIINVDVEVYISINNIDMNMPIISVSLTDKNVEDLESLQKDLGFGGRSEAIRAAMRTLVAETSERRSMVATGQQSLAAPQRPVNDSRPGLRRAPSTPPLRTAQRFPSSPPSSPGRCRTAAPSPPCGISNTSNRTPARRRRKKPAAFRGCSTGCRKQMPAKLRSGCRPREAPLAPGHREITKPARQAPPQKEPSPTSAARP